MAWAWVAPYRRRGPSSGGSPTPVNRASTSARGVTAKSINVVFPVVSLSSLAGQEGFASDPEFAEQNKAIKFFVGQVNKSGGINGRKINPIITTFDPTDESAMRALCKTWTEGSPAAFAVLDGIGDWTGDNELCVAQEGKTPFLGQWTTVTNYTNQGSPYLWWTGPDQAVILQAVVNWGLSSHRLGGSNKVGVIAGNRASDQLALKDYLLPDLRNAGIVPVVKTIDADPDDTATTNTQAPLVVQQLRSAGVTSIIPLIPFNVFYPVLAAETAQQYFPKLLLSDYESSIDAALGLLPVPYEKALDGQEGVTTWTLGGVDDDSPVSQGGYDQGVQNCWVPWHKAYPEVPAGKLTDFLEEQGPIVGWCQVDRSVRRGGEEGRPRSQPALLRHRHVQDQELPGHVLTHPELRAEQTVRADRSTRWSSCGTTCRPPASAGRHHRARPRARAGSPSSPSSRCRRADRFRPGRPSSGRPPSVELPKGAKRWNRCFGVCGPTGGRRPIPPTRCWSVWPRCRCGSSSATCPDRCATTGWWPGPGSPASAAPRPSRSSGTSTRPTPTAPWPPCSPFPW